MTASDHVSGPLTTPDRAQMSSLAFLAEASAVMSESLDYEATLTRLAELVVPRLADWCVVHLALDGDTIRPVVVAHTDPAKAELLRELQRRYPLDPDAPVGPGVVVRTRRPSYHPDVDDDLLGSVAQDAEHLESLRSIGIGSAVIVPLTTHDRTLGTISMAVDRGRTWASDDLELAQELGRRAALAVDNARLYHEMEVAQAEARFRAALLQAQNEAGVEGLLVVSPAGEMISYNRRFAEMWGIDEEVLASRSDAAALAQASEQVVDAEEFVTRARQCYEQPRTPRRDEILLRDGRVLDRYGAPLFGDDGAYYGWAWYFRDVTEQKRTERALFESGERFAALARTLQESLLPPDLPDVRGVELATRYHPAGEGLDVGGDFYDVFQTSPRAWGIVVGDVCGKGAEAARLTALARYTVRAASMQARTPARILAMLNEALVRQNTVEPDGDDERFASVVYASLRRTGNGISLAVSSGGHPPALLVQPDGTVRRVGTGGTLLGLFRNADLVDEALELHPGDVLLLYTDGVTEARGPGGQLGEQGLTEVVRRCAGASARQLAEEVERVVLAHQGGTAQDDIAILAVRAC
ncbi:MAG: SpoIIE family protein phosphatase [Actinomycetota bacterium]|nr:SpoIIE family protein phosphatase [Actinomycetota bacterium]